MKTLLSLLLASGLFFACNNPDQVAPQQKDGSQKIETRTTNSIQFTGGLSPATSYSAATNTYTITNFTNVEFQPWGSSTWYAYTGKNYKVKCNCGSSGTGGCDPHFVASDPPEAYCTNVSCTVTCELDLTVTDTQANGGGLVAHYPGGGTFRPGN